MSALLESLAESFDGDAARREVLDSVLREGLPGARSEAWKYTSLRPLERRRFLRADAVADFDEEAIADIPSPRLVFVNGRFHARLSDTMDLAPGVCLLPLSRDVRQDDAPAINLDRQFDRRDEVFARLNAALADDGVVLRVDEAVDVPAPLHLVFIGVPADDDIAWHSRHLVELRSRATATIVEHHRGAGSHAHLGNSLMRVQLGGATTLTHVRIQDESPRATLLARTDAVLAGDAAYERVDLELGGGLSRHELNVRLEGRAARLSASGVLVADGRRHLDTRLGIEHIARDTNCDLLWRGLADGRGRAVFHGGIAIHSGADGSDARLSCKNLLLGDNAEIDAQPVLEIHADEVKAAHGATVGQLDPTALFYLRSRGLPETDARRLLTAAFCREVAAAIDPPALRQHLDSALDRALRRLEAP
ncbi:MAG: Fe-S cluster assembly protein SufD [Luteimonas sp.]